MNPNEYQQLATRTICDQKAAYKRLSKDSLVAEYKAPGGLHTGPIQLLHAVIGIAGEAGELATAIQRWIYYGKGFDRTNIVEELGDALWYIAEACDALGIQMESVMQANIAKLRKRYPEKYSDELAAEENRDRTAERVALEQGCTACAASGTEECRKQQLTEQCILCEEKPMDGLVVCYDHSVCDDLGQPRNPTLRELASSILHPDDCTCGPCLKTSSDAAEKQRQAEATYGESERQPQPKATKRMTIEEYRATCGHIVSDSYDRMCSACGRKPVHKSNILGICTDCTVDGK